MKPAHQATLARVASKVAGKWTRRGIRSVPYDDLYQEAFVVALDSVAKFDATRGAEMEGYLYRCAMNRVHDALTRAISPVSTRSNGNVGRMGRSVVGVEAKHEHLGADPADYDHLVFITQVRERLFTLASNCEDGQRALQVALGLTTVSALTETREEAASLYKAVRRLKHEILMDMKLYAMSKDARS